MQTGEWTSRLGAWTRGGVEAPAWSGEDGAEQEQAQEEVLSSEEAESCVAWK